MTRPDRRRLALVGAPLLGALALALVVAVGDVPVLRARDLDGGGRSRAAVAVRDHVIPFQKWGTKLFTLPHLEEAYDRVYYLTQAGRYDQLYALNAAVEEALREHDEVDLFLLAHGNRFVDWIEPIDPALRRKLRLVYNTGCGGARQAGEWIAAGARAYVGHPAPQSLSPVFYVFFLRRWVRGHDLAAAVDAGNRAAARRLGWLGADDPALDASAVLVGDGALWIGGGR